MSNSKLKRGDKGCVHNAITHPQPLFLEGRLKVATEGSLIKIFMANDAGWFLIENILTFLVKIAAPIVRLSSRRSPLWLADSAMLTTGILAGYIHSLTPASGGHLQSCAFRLVRLSYGQTSLLMSPLIMKCYIYITHHYNYIVLPCKNFFFHQIFHDSYAQTDVG